MSWGALAVYHLLAERPWASHSTTQTSAALSTKQSCTDLSHLKAEVCVKWLIHDLPAPGKGAVTALGSWPRGGRRCPLSIFISFYFLKMNFRSLPEVMFIDLLILEREKVGKTEREREKH